MEVFMEYEELENALREEARSLLKEDRILPAADVARRLEEIADELASIRHRRQTGIDASIGKRSGGKLEI